MEIKEKANITRRLVFSFIALILIFLLFGLYALYDIRTISSLTHTIYDHPLVVSNAALQANVSITKMHRNMKDVVLFQSPSRIDKSITAVGYQEQRVYEYLNIVRDRILGQEGKNIEVEARALFENWRPIREEVIALVHEGQKEAAAEITIGKGAGHVVALEEKMVELTQYARTKATLFLEETEKAHSRLKVTAIVFLLSGILASVLVASFTLKLTAASEKKIQESEKRYRLLIESQTDLVCRFLPDGTFSFVNDVFCQFFNRPKEALVGSKWQVIADDDNRELIERKLSALSSQNPMVVIENRIRSGHGDAYWMQFVYKGFFDADGNLSEVQSVGRDITDRRHAEDALIESEALQRLLVNAIPDLVWLKDQDGVYLNCNSTFERFFGAKESEIIGKTDYDFVDKDLADFFRANDRKAMAAGRPTTNEETLTFVDNGYQGLFETVKTPLQDAQGNLIGVLGIARDISQRTKAEKEKLELERKLKQAHKMESIGILAGGIAHDFNNILTSVLGYTELAMDGINNDTAIANYLQQIYISGNRARDLVKQILAFARQSDESTTPLRISAIVREALHFIRSSIPASIEIKQNIASDSLIMGNEIQIHQVLMNLYTNAAQAMEDTGGIMETNLNDITVDGSERHKRLGLKPGDYIELKVSDSGAGIAPEIIGSIFDPYFTTKDVGEGTGMGLAMVHGIVESYGGKITVDSDLGKGTVFTTYLPITWKRKENRSSKLEELPSGSEHILFVDDEPAIADVGRQILQRFGYSVTTQTSSVAAVELFRSKPYDFDLVITDMTMPNMTGDELAIELIKLRPDIPIILCTGYSKKISDEKASEIGIRAFAYKPMVKSELVKTVRKILDEAKGKIRP